MNTENPYQLLNPKYHSLLPEIISVKKITPLYDDSTHQIWQLETSDGAMVLKVCDFEHLSTSPFWQAMSVISEKNFLDQLDQFDDVYHEIAEITSLKIPELVLAKSASKEGSYPGFLLTRLLPGQMVICEDVDDQMIVALADHLSRIHQNKRNTWGCMTEANLTPRQWPDHLWNTLKELSDRAGIQGSSLDEIIEQALLCRTEKFVPIMPDLRWDQFLQEQGKLTALVDLDAFIIGPVELDFILLEYLLSEDQCHAFRQAYSHPIPDLDPVRKPYRLLLFLMNVLGENNLKLWMSVREKFQEV